MDSRLNKGLIACALLASSLMITGCSSNSDDQEQEAAPTPEQPPVDADLSEPEKGTDVSVFDFSSAAQSVLESVSSVEISVNRTGSVGPASVAYAAVAGDAAAGEDYRLAPAHLSWQDGETGIKSFSVEILTDDMLESEETIEFELSDPTGGSLGDVDATVLTIQEPVAMSCVELQATSVKADTTLQHPCYKVGKDLVVSGGAVLTIAAGVELHFAARSGLNVEADGHLIAEGTAEQPILMTGALKTPGYWDGIEIKSLASSTLKHVTVEYGGHPDSFNPAGIGLSFGGRAAIEDSIVRGSRSFGIALDDKEVIDSFARNTLTGNERGPLSIDVNDLGRLDVESSYTGNVDAAGVSRDYVLAIGDSVASDQRWKALGVEYRFDHPGLEVSSELVIDPGVRLVFPGAGRMIVSRSGTLKAVGTEEEPIVFTGQQASPGYWHGIQFTFNGNANEMDHTVVEYGGGGGNSEANVGVYGQNGRLSLSNSVLKHSAKYGFNFYSGVALSMANVTSTQNEFTGALYLNDVGQLDSNSHFVGNSDDRVILISDDLTKSQVLPNVGVPYWLVGGAPSQILATLTIEPGVELQFSSNGGFWISKSGALTAIGTADAPIVFTGMEKTPGFWQGIEFVSSDSKANIINHAVVEFGGSKDAYASALVSFWGIASHGTVSNTVLRGSPHNALEIRSSTTGSFSEGNTFEDIEGEELYVQP